MPRSFRALATATLLLLAVSTTSMVHAWPATAAAADCSYLMTAHWPQGVVTTVHYAGQSRCRFPAAQSGQARLLSKKGKVLSTGTPYSCAACTSGASTGSYSRAYVGEHLVLEYSLKITLPSGHLWGGLPAQCSGTGTRTMRCYDQEPFTVTLTNKTALDGSMTSHALTVGH